MPTTRKARRPSGTGPRAVARYKRTRITEPMRTPFSVARVRDASTSPGRDSSGSRPESSLIIRGNCFGDTSLTRKLLVSIGSLQDPQRAWSLNGARTGVTDSTPGRLASCGSGCGLYTTKS